MSLRLGRCGLAGFDLASPVLSCPLLCSLRVASPHLAWPHVTLPRRIQFCPVLSCPALSCPVPCRMNQLGWWVGSCSMSHAEAPRGHVLPSTPSRLHPFTPSPPHLFTLSPFHPSKRVLPPFTHFIPHPLIASSPHHLITSSSQFFCQPPNFRHQLGQNVSSHPASSSPLS